MWKFNLFCTDKISDVFYKIIKFPKMPNVKTMANKSGNSAWSDQEGRGFNVSLQVNQELCPIFPGGSPV